MEGRAWRWCSKCGRWSTTHGTDQHSGPARTPTAGGSAHSHANTLYALPSAWVVPFNTTPTLLDTCFVLLSLLPGCLLPLIFSAGLGFSVACLAAPLWPFLLAHWTLLFPVLFWSLCLFFSLYPPALPPSFPYHRRRAPIFYGRPRREGVTWRPRIKKCWNGRAKRNCHHCSSSKDTTTPTQKKPLFPPCTSHDSAAYLTATDALRAAMTAPHETLHHLTKEHCFPVIWDSGASISISSFRSDFVGPINKPPFHIRLQGIAKGLTIQGVGHVAWSFMDNHGMLRTLKLPAYYVPGATARLLSTTSLLQAYPNEYIQQESGRLILSGNLSDNLVGIEVLTDPRSNLHIANAYDSSVSDTVHSAFTVALSTTSARNANLNPAEKELLRWHLRLGHLSFKKVQFLLQSGALAFSEPLRRLQTSAARLTSCPMCASCQYGKQRRTPAPGRTVHTIRERQGALKVDDLFPGQKVSVDHFLSSTRGHLKHTYGKEDTKSQFSGGAIFVDHASGYIFISHQVHMTTHETLTSKEAFEAHCRDVGIVVAEYLSDNGSAFTSAAYRAHLQTFSQISRFAGVGAHHHNGIAERSIQTVMSIARTMLLHAAIHWPDVSDAALWPLAVDHAVRLHNLMPNPSTGISPHDLFTKTRWSQTNFQHFHVWGCPVYVLDKTISDGKKLPRWKPRSSRQVYVGLSDKHASSVPLCLSLESGAITPQFHVVFDEDFTTVGSDPSNLPDFTTPEWQELFGASTYQYMLDPDDEAAQAVLDQTHDDPPARLDSVSQAINIHLPPQPLSTPPPPVLSPTPISSPFPVDESPPPLPPPSLPQREIVGAPLPAPQQRELDTQPSVVIPAVPTLQTTLPAQQREQPVAQPAPAIPLPPSLPDRPSRQRRPPTRYGFDGTQGKGYLSATFNLETIQAFLTSVHHPAPIPSALKARAVKDPDLLSFNDAMNSPDKTKWMDAAQKEITALESKDTWEEVPMSDAKAKIIPGTWVFRIKRNPAGDIKKYKARYCVRGDLEDDDEEDNFAPVVSWSTVRLFLVLTCILEWTTVSLDFTNAFVQSVLDSPVWVHVPRGFVSKLGQGHCLQLKRSLYGLRRSPKLFYETCTAGFAKLGFTQSKFDPCLLYKPGMLIVIYVDDCGVGAANPNDIDQLVDDLRNLGFELTREGDFSEFFGIKLHKRFDGSLLLTQRGLIDKILKATSLEDCKPNTLPSSTPLGSDPDGPPMNESWSYPSVIGMLLYLSTNTRCDIAFAVSQVARFSATPKQSHATAVKSIIRYLKRTADQGMILRPSGRLDLDLYVDADFCGLFKHEIDSNPDSARSRTGYVVMLSGFPLIWKSQLQTSIACSTLEAEYTALSYSLKALIPLKRLLVEAATKLNLSPSIRTSIRARVFEDNQGAYFLATNHRITNRTRYFLNKWHWFWDLSHEFDLYKIDSHGQFADYFTKPLPRELFDHNRLLVQGW